MADDHTIRALSQITNGLTSAMVILVNCLKNTGALDDGRFERALEKTINQPQARSQDLDFLLLRHLLGQLRSDQPPDPRRLLRVIEGGAPDTNSLSPREGEDSPG